MWTKQCPPDQMQTLWPHLAHHPLQKFPTETVPLYGGAIRPASHASCDREPRTPRRSLCYLQGLMRKFFLKSRESPTVPFLPTSPISYPPHWGCCSLCPGVTNRPCCPLILSQTGVWPPDLVCFLPAPPPTSFWEDPDLRLSGLLPVYAPRCRHPVSQLWTDNSHVALLPNPRPVSLPQPVPMPRLT